DVRSGIAGGVAVGVWTGRAVSSYGFGMPGAVSGVIAVRQAGLRALDKGAVSASVVGEDELRAEGRLSNQFRLVPVIILQRQILRQALQHPDSAIQPVVHA